MTTIQLDALATAQRLTTELRHNVARLLTLEGNSADLVAIAMRGAEIASDALWKLGPDAKQRSGEEKTYEVKPTV